MLELLVARVLEIFNMEISSKFFGILFPICPEFFIYLEFQHQTSVSGIQEITVHINEWKVQIIRYSWRNIASSLLGRQCNLNSPNEGHLIEVLGLNRLEWFPINIPKHSPKSCWLKLLLWIPFMWNTLKCLNSLLPNLINIFMLYLILLEILFVCEWKE